MIYNLHICNFCKKNRRDVTFVIQADNANICDECVDLCVKIIKEEKEKQDVNKSRTR